MHCKGHAMGKILLLVLALAVVMGCTTRQSQSTEPGGGDPAAYEETYEQTNFYYEFEDILIPREIDPVDDEKYVFDDGRFLAGFRIFKGRVVTDDLFLFFLNNMQRDGWTKVVSIKSDTSTLVFSKPRKGCTIKIEDSWPESKVTVFAVQLREQNSVDIQVQDLPN